MNFPAKDNATRKRRPLNAPTPEVFPIPLDNEGNVKGQIKLTRYNGGDKGVVVLVPGYSATSSSFAIDTVEQNLVERLTGEGYDVWLFAYRGSPDSGNQQTDYTIDDIAKVDWPTAVAFIKKTTGKNMQVVAHCVGSMSCLMALLAAENGEMDAVTSVISSQLTLHPVCNWLNNFKSDLNVVPLLEKGVGAVIDLSTEKVGKFDVVYWNIPVPVGEECKNPVCKRIFSVFGPSYAHAQLNHATHDAMMEMFGPIAIKAGEQLTNILRKGYVVDKDGNNSYLPNVRKLDLPITFFAGELNQIFFPETSARTFAWLKAHMKDKPEGYYQREVVADYAHMDLFIGKDTSQFFYRISDVLEEQRKWRT
jgi:cholesterol oxidase